MAAQRLRRLPLKCECVSLMREYGRYAHLDAQFRLSGLPEHL